MADTQSNIKVSIDTTDALASIKNLQRQISAFHTSMAKSGAAANAVTSQMQQNLVNSINATGKFSAQMKTIRTTTESFTDSLQKNKFSLGEYFRYAGGASKSFGKLFKTEFDTINKVARENVKDLQTQYIKMGRDANGAMKAISVRPLSLDMNDLATKTMIASERQALLNQLLKQGSTNLLNFGKNTQWAGRQLMVGFTIPLITLGSAASKTFMDMETQAIRFKKVYGDLFTPKEETSKALEDITNLGKEFTKYGVAVSATVGLASEAAAAGFKGLDLQRQTAAATKLSILGQVESQKALETTIALQNAFSMSSADLATNIDFLNAVENQTVLSLDDMSTAIPKAAPVIQQLGGDVKDLAFFMTAMKEGGINASEGANALKSGLASIINPTGKANDLLLSFGINTKKIVESNRGDLKKTVIDFASALNQLDPLNRAQAIEQMFGKFQFARLSTLFANVTKEGTQAARVLDLAGSSIQDLAALSEKELGMTSESAMNKFKAAVENLKLSLVPVGEEFLKAVTPIAAFFTKILDGFNNLGDGTKKVIVTMTAIVAGLGPVLLMTFGLLANGIANIIKGFTSVKTLFNKTGQSSATLGTEVKYMTLEQRNAAAVAASLDQVHNNLAQTFTAEATAVDALTRAYQRAIAAQAAFMPTSVPLARGPIKKRAKGKPAVVGGTGNKDSELSLLMPGETVIPTDMSSKYGSLINAMITDSVPGYAKGRTGTEGTNVKIPGGFAAAHFGGSNSMSGTDLLSMLEGRSDAMAVSLRKMVEGMSNADDQLTVFTNEVVATSSELNEALGKTGSGKKVSTQVAKTEMLNPKNAAVRDIELQRQLEKAGVPIEEIRTINKKLTAEITDGFTKLGDITEITAEDLDKLVTEAYKKVSETDARVDAAYKNMKDITTVTDPNLLTRRPVTKESYKESRRTKKGTSKYYQGMERMVGESNVPYSKEAQFRITNSMADSIGLTSKDASRVYKQFSDEVKMKLASLRGDITAFTVEFEKQAQTAGLKTGNAYKTGVDKSGLNDVYVESRQRNSPHELAAKDGRDDGIAYEKAKEQAIAQSGKDRRFSQRPQGPAPIGPEVPAGATMLNIVAPLTPEEKSKIRKEQRKEKILSKTKAVGSKLGTRLGGGTALLGANMALSAVPDFAGKEVIQGTMTGANMGMLFGPWGAAAGAAIGLVSSAIGNLIEKQKEQKAVAEATFKASADVATFFGNEAANALTPISSFARQMVVIGKGAQDAQASLGLAAQEISNFKQMVEGLPEDNPLAVIVNGISNESDPAKIKETAQSFVQMQVALGQLKPEDGQKLMDLILTASGKSSLVGTMASNITTQADAIKNSINGSASSFDTLKLTIGQTVAAAANASSLQELQVYLDGIAASGFNGAAGINALRQSFLDLGNTGAADLVGGLARKGLDMSQIATVVKAVNSGLSFDAKGKSGKDLLKLAADFNSKAFSTQKTKSDVTNPYKSQNDSLSGQNAMLDAQIKALEKKKKLIDDQIAAQKKVTDELKKQHDFENAQADLATKIVEAKIRGNYLEAASLRQQQIGNAVEYKQEQALTPLEDKSAKLQDQIDALKDKKGENSQVINSNNVNSNNTTTNNYTQSGPGTTTGFEEGSFKNPIATKSLKEAYQNVPQLKPKVGGLLNPGLDPSKWNMPGIGGLLGASSARSQIKKYAEAQFIQPGQFFSLDHNGFTYKFRVEKDKNITMIGKPVAIKKEPGKASGGLIKGPGTGTSDSIRATLGYAGGGGIRVSNGEFVVKASSVRDYGLNTMNAINDGTATVGTNSGGTVYNINMPITSNATDPKAVGDYVIKQLKLVVDKNNKGNSVMF